MGLLTHFGITHAICVYCASGAGQLWLFEHPQNHVAF